MLLNADQLLAELPHPVPTKIIGETNLLSIALQKNEHNGNLASINQTWEMSLPASWSYP